MLQRFLDTEVRSTGDLLRFVSGITGLAVTLAVSFDVILQTMILHADIDQALTSWIGTVLITVVVAVPVSRMVGKTSFRLYLERQEVLRVSRTDELTGLGNRRTFREASAAVGDRPAVIAIVDVDRFKSVNDRFGHGAGDEVIAGLARILGETIGSDGILCRMGGEEFAWLTAADGESAVFERMERARAAVGRSPIRTAAGPITVTISCGIAARQAGEDLDRVYCAADKALYRAKDSGRNQVRIFRRDGDGTDPYALGDLVWADEALASARSRRQPAIPRSGTFAAPGDSGTSDRTRATG